MSTLRLGTRGSLLAMAQARMVAGLLEDSHQGLSVEIVEIRTSGDKIVDVPLGPSLGQSFFTKEIEDALLENRVDVAVHSCKDLATRMPEGLALGAVLPREDPRDALVSATGGGLASLPAGARVGTGSVRRRAFLARARPDLDVRNLRGNVPTRVRAVDEGRFDAVVLAMAGLRRLELEERVAEALAPDIILPAAAQGAVAVQLRDSDEGTVSMVGAVDDPATRAEVTAERACLRTLEAGCQAPVGVLARVEGGRLLLRGAVLTPDGDARAREEGAEADAPALGESLARALLDSLGRDSLRDAPWAGPPPRREESPA